MACRVPRNQQGWRETESEEEELLARCATGGCKVRWDEEEKERKEKKEEGKDGVV